MLEQQYGESPDVHRTTLLCIHVNPDMLEQQYGESPDTYNSDTVKARMHLGLRY